MNRYILLGLHIISLVLLGFGWVKDMLHINVTAHYVIDFELLDEKRSVLGTLNKLWQTANYLPFLLIFVFGIVIPIIKSLAIFYLLAVKNSNPVWLKFVTSISKWAMADVFAISIFVAFLAAGSMDSTKANVEIGFYFFAAYVVLSGVVSMLLPKYISSNQKAANRNYPN
jgi:paraquat-inducible protein A